MRNNHRVDRRRLFLSPPHMGREEIRFIIEAFKSNYIAPLGPMVDAFEKEFAEYTGIKHCVALSSGTAAMHLALRCLGVGPGDEVFASTLTFIGSVSPIVFVGATPVFIDSERASWNMDPDLLEEELARCATAGKLPKVVVPTDLYGQCCNLPRILKICAEYKVPVIVDSAEAVGARYKSEIKNEKSEMWVHAGVGAKAAVFSFNGNKIITTSGGGMLASDDNELIDYARFLSQQARDPFVHYEHSTIGFNYRISNLLAALGRAQLRVLEDRVRRRREIFEYYRKGLEELPGIEFMPEVAYGKSNRWLTIVLIIPEEFGADREQVRLALEQENIEARPVWKPMHLQPVFDWREPKAGSREPENVSREPRAVSRKRKTLGCEQRIGKEKYPCRVFGGEVAEDLFNRGLCLPSGTAMTQEDLDRVIGTILKCRGK